MSKKMTGIAYADYTCNFQNWYCTKISAGCKNCYMLEMKRIYKKTDDSPQWREAGVKEFEKIPSGAVIFVGDMYDVYHEHNQHEWIIRTHEIIASRPDVTVLLLTKRPELPPELIDKLVWSDNLWLGVTVEDINNIPRITSLKRLPAKHRWLSCEPLLEDISVSLRPLRLSGINWIVCGGESGRNRRPFNQEWAINLMLKCRQNSVPFFFKQSGGLYPGHNPYLNGEQYYNFPPEFLPLKYNTDAIETIETPKQLQLF